MKIKIILLLNLLLCVNNTFAQYSKIDTIESTAARLKTKYYYHNRYLPERHLWNMVKQSNQEISTLAIKNERIARLQKGGFAGGLICLVGGLACVLHSNQSKEVYDTKTRDYTTSYPYKDFLTPGVFLIGSHVLIEFLGNSLFEVAKHKRNKKIVDAYNKWLLDKSENSNQATQLENRNDNTQYQEVVYLKNGSIIRGTIIEQVPNISLKIETKDHNVFFYKLDEVEKITKEASIR